MSDVIAEKLRSQTATLVETFTKRLFGFKYQGEFVQLVK
jgi:hypothetical protein